MWGARKDTWAFATEAAHNTFDRSLGRRRIGHDGPLVRDTDGQALARETERLCQLYSFTDEVQSRVDMLAVQEAAEFIPDLAA